MRRPNRTAGGSSAGRIATSASRRVRLSRRFVVVTSSSMPGCADLSAAKISGSSEAISVSVVVTLIDPEMLRRQARRLRLDRSGRQPRRYGGGTLDRRRVCRRAGGGTGGLLRDHGSPRRAGADVAALPCYLGDRSPALMRLSSPVEAMRSSLWLLTHEHLRRTARIRAFMELVGAALARKRKPIEGR